MTLKRISSTQIQEFLKCPRSWARRLAGEELLPSEAMAFGTLLHACIEFFIDNGSWPSVWDVQGMEGNYDDPAVAYAAHPHLWDEVVQCFEVFEEALPKLGLGSVTHQEQNVEEWDFDINGVVLGGYIDMLDPENCRIIDWKTRGVASAAPRGDDFRRNIQLRYYAALAAVHFGWMEVTVEHVTILRPSKNRGQSRIMRESTTFDSDDLLAFLDWLRWLMPQMQKVAENPFPWNVLPNRQAKSCFQYGACDFYNDCPVTQFPGLRPLECYTEEARRMRINSPQAPDDPKPVPMRRRSLDAAGCKPKMTSILNDQGVLSIGDLVRFLGEDVPDEERVAKLIQFKGIGKKGAADLLENLDLLLSTEIQ